MPHAQTNPILTFVIPVRHPENCKDWEGLTKRLTQTLNSVTNQSSSNWSAVVVANKGARLPQMPAQVTVVHVDYEPNPYYDITKYPREQVYDAVRLDKGRRILAGMMAVPTPSYFMIMDDDDFIHADLTRYVESHAGAFGWSLHKGYVWSEDGRLVYLHPAFSSLCGTSHIIRSDLYRLPDTMENAREEDIKSMLGSHTQIEAILSKAGTPLSVLPFPGAVYRVGHSNAHSKSRHILRSYLINKKYIKNFWKIPAQLMRFKILDTRTAQSFGMPH